MSEIKNIVFTKTNANLIQSLTSFVNHLLPLDLKFKKESFVIFENGISQGLITLDKDSKSNTRLKITKLILEQNALLCANQLVKYVISRYRAMGASSFYIVIDEKNPHLINIFKNDLNFRFCGCEHLFRINNLSTNYGINLKPCKKEHLKTVCDIYNDNINSYNRVVFSRQKYQFKNDFQKYIFYNEEKNEILGYFEVATSNNVDFYLNFALDSAYNIYLMDAIKFIYAKLARKNKNFNLYIKIKDYFLNSKELIAILKENNLEYISKGQIWAKDYYQTIKAKNILQNAKIIFNDPTTA